MDIMALEKRKKSKYEPLSVIQILKKRLPQWPMHQMKDKFMKSHCGQERKKFQRDNMQGETRIPERRRYNL